MNWRSRQQAIQTAGRAAAVCAACVAAFVLDAATPKYKERSGVTFSVPGGVYTNDLKVELRAAGAVIRFTTDGSEPDANADRYTEAVPITGCAVLRARAFFPDGRVSAPVSHSYILLAENLRGFSSAFPLVIVNSVSGEIESTEKTVAGLHILENRPERTTLPDRADFAGLALLRRRGYTSLRYPKPSFAVKLVNELGEPHDASLLDMPKDSDWVLYGPYPDKTLMRDVLAYELSREMGHWAPRTRFVEAFVQEGSGRLTRAGYAGVYVLEEKVTRGRARLDITKLEAGDTREPEISGGYLFKKDHTGRGDRRRTEVGGPPMAGLPGDRTGFPTPPGGFPADPAGFLPPYGNGGGPARGNRQPPGRAVRNTARNPGPVRSVTNYIAGAVREVVRLDDAALFPDEEGFRTALQRTVLYYVEPEPDEITPVQRAWLKDYLNRFEAALYGPDFTDPKEGYAAFIDADSFIDYHLFAEVTKNVDAFRFSTFYHKDRGGRLKMGPAWDWNLSFGNCDGKQGYIPEHWLWPQLDDQQYSWFRRLFEDPDFGQRYVDRWGELRTKVFATSKVLGRIDALAAQLDEAQKRNFSKWDILGRDVTPNYFIGQTYDEEIDWMKGWTSNRLEWIARQFLPAPTVKQEEKLTLATTVADAQIHFTLDGSDPRAPGGEVAAKARTFQSPVALAKGEKLFARVRSGARWSPPRIVP